MEKITLKKVLTPQNKVVVVILMSVFFGILYTGSGAISHQSGVYLAMPKFEQAIPFWTWTIWIYIVLYPIYLVWGIFSYKDILEMNKTVYSFLVLTIISCIIFILYPVNYPREFFPLSFDTDLTTMIFRAMRAADKPSNCLPSLHVGLCFTVAYGFYKESKTRFWFSIFISILIALSTLTTKQHYIYDIVLGFIIPSFIFYFFKNYTQVDNTKIAKSIE